MGLRRGDGHSSGPRMFTISGRANGKERGWSDPPEGVLQLCFTQDPGSMQWNWWTCCVDCIVLPGLAIRGLPSTRLCDLTSPQGAERPACSLDATTTACVLWERWADPSSSSSLTHDLAAWSREEAHGPHLEACGWSVGGGVGGQAFYCLLPGYAQVSSGPSVSCRERWEGLVRADQGTHPVHTLNTHPWSSGDIRLSLLAVGALVTPWLESFGNAWRRPPSLWDFSHL